MSRLKAPFFKSFLALFNSNILHHVWCENTEDSGGGLLGRTDASHLHITSGRSNTTASIARGKLTVKRGYSSRTAVSVGHGTGKESPGLPVLVPSLHFGNIILRKLWREQISLRIHHWSDRPMLCDMLQHYWIWIIEFHSWYPHLYLVSTHSGSMNGWL